MASMTEKKYEYPCTSCGLCCSNHNPLDAIEAIKNMRDSGLIVIDERVLDFPYKMLPNGKCENLLPNNRCGVYEHRPILCQLEGTARAMGQEVELLLWHNAEACNHFMTEAGIPEDGQINLDRWIQQLIDRATDEKTKEYLLNQQSHVTSRKR